MKILRSIPALVAAAAMTFAAPVQVKADLGDQLENMLGVNVQVNSAGAISTARRGGFYGGSVYVRGKVMNVNVLNFTPPSFAAGCGGVDLFGGSFSMINAAQFVQLLRSIAQNAAGYAFHLALKNICEQCSTIISGLQRAVQEMNQFTGNSCQLAKGVVNSGIAAMELSDVKGMQGQTIQEGYNDAFDAFWGSLESSISSLTATSSGGTSTYEDRYEVNVVWKAMQDHSMSGWFSSGDQRLMESLMTLTGTVVLSGPVDDADGQPSRNVKPAVAGGGITLRDIIYGNPSARFLRCADAEKCLNMRQRTGELKGLEQILEEDIIGTGPADSTSILFRIINGTGGSSETGALIGQLGSYGSMLLSIAEASPAGSTAPYELFDEIKGYLAYELGALFVADVISAVEQGVAGSNYETAYADDWRRNDFARAVNRMQLDLAAIAEQTPAPKENLQLYMQMHDYLVLNHSPFK